MGQSNAFLIGKIKGILGEEAEEIELPAHMVTLGSSEPPARDLAPQRSEGIPDCPEGRTFSFAPMVEIAIPTTNHKPRPRECVYTSNGHVFQIQRRPPAGIPHRHTTFAL